MAILVEDYMKQTKEERQKHLDLTTDCKEIGGDSCQFKGLLAYHLNTTLPINGNQIYLAHACHNGICSNVLHLYWGTPKENVNDIKTNPNGLPDFYKPIILNGIKYPSKNNAKNQLGLTEYQLDKLLYVEGNPSCSRPERFENMNMDQHEDGSFVNARTGMTPWNKGKKTGQVPWNKGKTGVYTEQTLKLMKESQIKASSDPEWKGRQSIAQKKVRLKKLEYQIKILKEQINNE